ncbi:hypothetical protein FKM82_029202 [Ascaphus truei]
MATYTEVKVQGYEEYCKEVEKHKGQAVFTYFSGSKNAEGVSWCPDCVTGTIRLIGPYALKGSKLQQVLTLIQMNGGIAMLLLSIT